MLSFIPMNDVASVFRLDRDNLDAWGHAKSKLIHTGKCRILYNTDLIQISQYDGQDVRPSVTVLFKGLVKCKPSDRFEFIDELGEVQNLQIEDVFFMKNWEGKVHTTRLVFANGKRE